MTQQPRSRLIRVLSRLGVDRAVFFAAAARIWQLPAGVVTLLLVARYFTPETQGYYYTFSRLLGFQIVADLGFLWVIVHVASHEWSKLELDHRGRLRGEPATAERLADLIRRARNWFALAGVGFVVVAGLLGVLFFRAQPEAASTDIAWLGPWLCAVGLVGAGLVLSPFIAVLEGCNQVHAVYRLRLVQAVVGNLVVWPAILLGANLWVVVAAGAVQLAAEAWLVLVRFRPMWRSLPRLTKQRIRWSQEVWPLQWRLAAQSVMHYVAFCLFTPIIFHYHGSALAGRMGMTWTVLTALQMAAFSWIRTRASRFGMLVARKDYGQLDRTFRRSAEISTLVLAAALGAFCAALWGLNSIDYPLAQDLAGRLLSPIETLVFAATVLLSHLPQCFGVYLRAHKRDPLIWLWLPANAAVGLSAWWLGSRYGVFALGLGFLAITGLVTLPGTAWIWARCRVKWHAATDCQTA